MEPLSGFISIVSLIRIFKQERGEGKKADRQALMDWLEYHHHEDLKNFIANTAAVRAEVDSILAADHDQMLQKLDAIQEIVATLLSRVDEFRGLSHAMAPHAQISDQAVSILRQFNNSGGETLRYERYSSGDFCLQTDLRDALEVTEPRFLPHDFEQLVALGLLMIKDDPNGTPLYMLTRNAVRYLPALDARAASVGKPSTKSSTKPSTPE